MRKRRLVTGMLMVVVAVGSMAVQGKISHNAVRAVAEEKENIAVCKGSFQFGSIPVKNKIYNRKDLVEGKSKYSLRATIPESYDARNEGVVTDVKNQGNYATCWSFAALGSAESGILKKGMVDSVDLSELQLAYAAYNKLIDPLNLTEEDIWYPKELSREVYNYAGSRFLATRTLARWQGAVQENDASYMSLIENEDAFSLSDELMYQKDAYHLKNTEMVGEASAGVGESFIFCDGAWNDCNKTSRGNICLKAFTSVVDDVPCEDIISDVEEIKVDIGKSKRVDYQLVPANATGMITWKS